MNSVLLTPGPHSDFAQMLKEAVTRLIAEDVPDTARIPVSAQDVALLGVINNYLKSHRQLPIDAASITDMPADFPSRLRDWCDSLQEYTNVFTEGREAEFRTESPEENLLLAELYDGLDRYFLEKRVSINWGLAAAKPVLFAPYEGDPAENLKPRIWKLTPDPEKPGARRLVEVEHIDFSRKPMICIGGGSAIHSNTKSIAAMIGSVESLLGGKEVEREGVDVYCISHPVSQRVYLQARVCRYNADPEHYASESAVQFVREHIMPYLEEGAKPGTRQDIATIKQRLRKCNLVAFSYGTVFLQEGCNALTDALLERGYAPQEVRDALAEVYAMHLSIMCRVDGNKERGSFSSIYVISPEDRVTASRVNVAPLLEGRRDGKSHLIRKNENELIVITTAPKTLDLAQLAASGEEKGEDKGRSGAAPIMPHARNYPNTNGHLLPLYTTRMRTGDGRRTDPSRVEFSLRNAAVRSDRLLPPSIEDTLLPTRILHPECVSLPTQAAGDLYMTQLLRDFFSLPATPTHGRGH